MSQTDMLSALESQPSARLIYDRRCSHYPETGAQCRAEATHRFAVHGEVRPIMGAVCEPHGREVVDEFAEKLPGFGYGLAAIEAGS